MAPLSADNKQLLFFLLVISVRITLAVVNYFSKIYRPEIYLLGFKIIAGYVKYSYLEL